MIKIVGAACLIAATCIAAGQTIKSEFFQSVHARHDVELSTDPQTAFWRGAIPTYAEEDNHGAPVPRHRPEVLYRRTSNNLYMLFVCP